jgi:hypothetical protein
MVCVTLVILSVRDADTVSTTSRLPIRRARLCPQCGYGHFDAEAEDLGDFAQPFAILLNLVPGQPWRSAARCPLLQRTSPDGTVRAWHRYRALLAIDL